MEVLTKARALLPAGANVQPELLQEIWSVLEDYKVTQFVTLDLGMVDDELAIPAWFLKVTPTACGYPLAAVDVMINC